MSDTFVSKFFQDERDAMVPQEPKWERSKYLNLSFQDLGTAYQRPEILNVMRGAHKTLVTLKLASNQLASFPRAGGSFPHLITLDISSNLLQSTSSLPRAPLLSALNLSSNLITASWRTIGPLSSYRRLKSLWVANNPIR
jgi:Leucine-rich repeat (LRR) protein